MEKKICPLLYAGYLSYAGSSEQYSDDIECLGDQCGCWDSFNKVCSLVSLARKGKQGIPKPQAIVFIAAWGEYEACTQTHRLVAGLRGSGGTSCYALAGQATMATPSAIFINFLEIYNGNTQEEKEK